MVSYKLGIRHIAFFIPKLLINLLKMEGDREINAASNTVFLQEFSKFISLFRRDNINIIDMRVIW